MNLSRTTKNLHSLPRIVLLSALALLIAPAAGCDGLARLMGAPTTADYKAVEAKAQQASDANDELTKQIAETERARRKAEAAALATQATQDSARALMSETAQRMGAAKSAVEFNALEKTFNELKRQVAQAQGDHDAAITAAADLAEQAAQMHAAFDANAQAIEGAVAQVKELDDKRAAAIAKAAGSVKVLGDAAGSLGVPGAGAIGGTIGGVLENLIGYGLPSAGVVGAFALKLRKQRNGAREVIATTEKHDLLGGVERERKVAAKRSMSPAAKKELAVATAGLVKGETDAGPGAPQ